MRPVAGRNLLKGVHARMGPGSAQLRIVSRRIGGAWSGTSEGSGRVDLKFGHAPILRFSTRTIQVCWMIELERLWVMRIGHGA